MIVFNFLVFSGLLKLVVLQTTENATTIKISECILPTITNITENCDYSCLWPEGSVSNISRYYDSTEGQLCCDSISPQLILTNTVLSNERYYFCCKPNITEEQFKNAVIISWPTAKPTTSHYNAVMNFYETDGGISTVRELAMFLAQLILESAGFVYKEELCSKRETGCPHVKNEGGIEGQDYYGRGYIQLTHAYNYRNASLAIFGNDCLLEHPDLVASNEDLSCKTSFWYWKYNVHVNSSVLEGHFDVTTTLVNGPASKSRERRFNIYSTIYKAFSLPGDPMY